MRRLPRPAPFVGTVVPPTNSPLPRFAAPPDESVLFISAAAAPERHVLEHRPKGERLLVHAFAGDTPRSLAVAIHPAEPGLSKVRVSLSQSIVDALGRLDRKSTRLNSSHVSESRMPSSA